MKINSILTSIPIMIPEVSPLDILGTLLINREEFIKNEINLHFYWWQKILMYFFYNWTIRKYVELIESKPTFIDNLNEAIPTFRVYWNYGVKINNKIYWGNELKTE